MVNYIHDNSRNHAIELEYYVDEADVDVVEAESRLTRWTLKAPRETSQEQKLLIHLNSIG